MQYYRQFEQSRYGLPVLAIAIWALFCYRNRRLISHGLILNILLTWNIANIHECIYEPINVISICLLIESIVNRNLNYMFLLSAMVTICFPAYTPLLVLSTLFSSGHTKMGKIKGVCLCLTGVFSIYYIHFNTYLSSQFAPHSGVSWILLTHIFKRYLLLYQTITITAPFLVTVPLYLSKAPLSSKLAVQWLIIIYFIHKTTFIHLWTLYLLQALLYRETMPKLNRNKQIIWNVLTVMAIVLSMCSYLFYRRLIWVWENTHFISIGYILIQLLLFWGTHSVYLSESLTLLEDVTSDKPQPKLIVRLIEYFKKRWQEM